MRLKSSIAVLATASALTACGDGERQTIDAYVENVNKIQQRSAPAFKRAQEAYVAFSRNAEPTAQLQQRLVEAERTMRSTRAELGALRPPGEAAELHRRVLRVYDMSAGLAHETALLGRYLPASEAALKPLPASARRLERGLGKSTAPAGQRRTLRQYAAATRGVVEDLRPLDPPPLLEGQHNAQVRQLESARSLAVRLEKAIAARDAKRVAGLLLRFRRLNAGGEGQERRAARALSAYRERYRAISFAQAGVHREMGRIERSVG